MERLTSDTLTRVFGSPFADYINEAILVIGKDQWNRADLADIGVTQLRAARIISELAKEVKAKTTKELYSKLSPASLASSHGVGLCSLFVLWRAFEDKGLDSSKWYWKGRPEAIVTFHSVKAREARAQAAEKKARPRRAQIALDEAKRGNGNGKP